MPKKKLPRLNYLWIGPPKSAIGIQEQILDSDVIDVIKMTRKCKNPICYYCLDEYKDFYVSLFEEQQVDIEVVSVDEYLAEILDHNDQFNEAVTQMMAMKEELLHPPRNRIIDRVSFKDAFTLFLLATQGGYTLDTNVKVVDDLNSNVSFEAYDSFKIPYLDSPIHGKTIDCWMMYASPEALEEPLVMLKRYLSLWEQIQEYIRNKETDIPSILSYHKLITGLMIGSISKGLKVGNDNVNSTGYDQNWEFKFNSLGSAQITGLSIEKIYGNSHKPWHECLHILDTKFTEIENLHTKYPNRTYLIQDFRDMLEKEKDIALNGKTLVTQNIRLLDNVLNGILLVDQYATVLRKISSNYKSKDPHKRKFSKYIFDQINSMYEKCHAPLFRDKNIDYSTFEDNIEDIKKIIDEACNYHHDKPSMFKDRDSRFENCKTSLQELETDDQQKIKLRS